MPGSVLYAEPLYGCKCTACDEAMGGELHASLAHTLNQDLPKFPVKSVAVLSVCPPLFFLFFLLVWLSSVFYRPFL